MEKKQTIEQALLKMLRKKLEDDKNERRLSGYTSWEEKVGILITRIDAVQILQLLGEVFHTKNQTPAEDGRYIVGKGEENQIAIWNGALENWFDLESKQHREKDFYDRYFKMPQI